MMDVDEKKMVDTDAVSAALITSLPESCDYLVIGGGATGMAFVDTLLKYHATNKPDGKKSPLKVVMVDKHLHPGGQWNDSYGFVRLHQPSNGYGVETERLEPASDESDDSKKEGGQEQHRATRMQILEYYENIRHKLESKYEFQFVGGVTFDFTQLSPTVNDDLSNNDDGKLYRINDDNNIFRTIRVMKKVVDARFLEPDLPIFVPPKFAFNSEKINCVPVNSLVNNAKKSNNKSTSHHYHQHYVIIGGGKTGMDAITYLLKELHVDPNDIVWVVPHDAWITARENIGSCMEFLHTCTTMVHECTTTMCAGGGTQQQRMMVDLMNSSDLFQYGFLEWEKQGKVYRFDTNVLPTKFKDATLCKEEMAVIKKVSNVLRGHGRVKEIQDEKKTLVFEDGTNVTLPWSESDGGNGNCNDAAASNNTTLFVHCSAGAFNYSKQPAKMPPVFDTSNGVITIQDVYGTPGFCFVGSIIGKLESLSNKLSDAEKNDMCLTPQHDAEQARLPLGPSGGDIGIISKDHGLVQRLTNLRSWLKVPEVREWLVGHRLFNLGHLSVEEISTMVEETWTVLVQTNLVEE